MSVDKTNEDDVIEFIKITARGTKLTDWIAEWCCLITAICGILSFTYFLPQIELRFEKWRWRKTIERERR